MRIQRSAVVSTLLLIATTIFFCINMLNQTENVIIYIVTLIMLGINIISCQKREFVNANNFFFAYYTYVLALGPIFFLIEQLRLNFNYYIYVLGGLLCFAWGTLLTNLYPTITRLKGEKTYIRVKLERIHALRILWVISLLAGIWYAYKNRGLLFSGDIQNGRVAAMAGNGALLQLSQMATVIIPMMFEVYYDGPKLYGKKYSSKIEIVIMTIISFAVLLMQGYRSYAMTVGLCLAVVIVGKLHISSRKVIALGALGVVLLEILGFVRSAMSSSTHGIVSLINNFRTSLVVNCSNLGHVLNTFPNKTPFQYGKTYWMNFAILKPGPDMDFTLWLKEQVGISFAGGGRTPSILGEAYINFGIPYIFISMFLLGILGTCISNYFDNHGKSFFGAYLMWQFAHCASGGIANVILPITINWIIYMFVMMFPVCLRGKSK